MGTKVWISVRSPNSRTVNIALLFFLAVYSKINIDIFSKSIHFFRLAVDECFYTIFYFPNNKYIATFVSAFGQGFVFWLKTLGRTMYRTIKLLN